MRVIENILIFVTVVFPKIYSYLSVPLGLTFLDIYTYIGVCLTNDKAPLAFNKHLFCDISLSRYL